MFYDRSIIASAEDWRGGGGGGGGWERQKGMGVSSQCYCSFLSLTTLRSPVFTNEYRLFATTDYKPYLLLKASGTFLMIIRSGDKNYSKTASLFTS